MRLGVRQPCVEVFGNGFLALCRLAGDGRDKIRRDGLCRVCLFNQFQPGKLRLGNFLFGGFQGFPGLLNRY
jgi:hypothetical protein